MADLTSIPEETASLVRHHARLRDERLGLFREWFGTLLPGLASPADVPAWDPAEDTGATLLELRREYRRMTGRDAGTIDREIEEAALGKPAPLSCDLTADPLACAILRAWARQPWQAAHRAALVDRMEETGRTAAETRWAREIASDGWFRELPVPWPSWNRTARRDVTRVWGRMLGEQFGHFANTLHEGAEDTPQGG